MSKYKSDQSKDLPDGTDDDLQAIQDSLDDLARGEEGIPVDEAFAKIRAEYGVLENQ